MSDDTYAEVLTVIIAGAIIFVMLCGIIVFFMLYYQRKKIQHVKEKAGMEKQYAEQILQSRLEMQEQTFDSISQEIHDNVGQMLSLAKVQLSIAEQNETVNKELIADIKNNISNALTDLRDIAKSLSSDRLHQLSLPQAIEQELQRINHSGFMDTQLNVSGTEQSVSEQKKIILFRIMQECFQNILKHAKASEISVDVQFNEEALQIDISDNGIGFNPDEKYANASGLGLQNIISRTELIGGNATIFSEPNQGTHITLNIPYEMPQNTLHTQSNDD